MKDKLIISLFMLTGAFGLSPTKAQQTEQQDTTIHLVVEELAQFSGDWDAFLAKHLRYPERCKAAGIQGLVMATLVVNKDGSLSNIEIKRSPCTDLTTETIRMLRKMPRWTPGKIHGQPVRMRFTIPIMFKLTPEKIEENETEKQARTALEAVYADVIRKGKLSVENPKASEKTDLVKLHTTKDFCKQYKRIEKWDAKHTGEVGFLSADFWTDSQDLWSKATVTRVALQADGSCMGYVFLQDLIGSKGQDNIVVLRLVRENKEWKVDDIMTQGSLRRQMEQYIQENHI